MALRLGLKQSEAARLFFGKPYDTQSQTNWPVGNTGLWMLTAMPLGDGKVLGMWLCGSDGCALTVCYYAYGDAVMGLRYNREIGYG